MLDRHQPSIIVNPAAYTAVDKALTEVKLAMAVNAHAPGVMAEWAERHDALLIHYSTDYVFDGTKDGTYREDDPANPQSAYGRSKWGGEQAIRTRTAHHLILRTSWVVGPHGGNFLKTILRLAHERDSLTVVADQIGAPTPAALIADVTAQLISRYRLPTHKFDYGTYHLAASGETSWFEYARFVVQLAEQQRYPLRLATSVIRPIPTSAYQLPAPRPANSRLDCSKLSRHFGLALPHWQSRVSPMWSGSFTR